MNLGGYTIALGGYSLSGDVTDLATLDDNAADLTSEDILADGAGLDRESTGIDFQIEGDVAGSSLMVTGGYVLSNTHGTSDVTGMSFGAQINPLTL